MFASVLHPNTTFYLSKRRDSTRGMLIYWRKSTHTQHTHTRTQVHTYKHTKRTHAGTHEHTQTHKTRTRLFSLNMIFVIILYMYVSLLSSCMNQWYLFFVVIIMYMKMEEKRRKSKKKKPCIYTFCTTWLSNGKRGNNLVVLNITCIRWNITERWWFFI